MKTSKRSASRARRRAIRPTGNFSQATLLGPSQVDYCLANMSGRQPERLKGRWLLTGTVSKKGFAGLVANTSCHLLTQITALQRPSGAAYVVFSCQLGNWQHRFVLPLYDARVRDYLAVEINEPFSLQLRSAGSNEAFIFYSLIPRHDLKSILKVGRMVDLKDRDSLFWEWANLVGDMHTPAGLPSLSATHCVRDVDVSALIPEGAGVHFDDETCLEDAA